MTQEERHIWVLYFASLSGWLLHPGAGSRGHIPPELTDLAHMADRMLELTPKGET